MTAAVDTRTGEIVEALSAVDARRLVDKIRGGVDAIWLLVQRAFDGRAWVSLGYQSWDEMCETEFAGARIRLPRSERIETAQRLHQGGMSRRAIESVLGVSKSTVDRDLATVPDGTDEPSRPATVTSLDGRRRPATQPRPVGTLPPLTSEQVADAKDEGRRGSLVAGLGMACRDLIHAAGDDPEQIITDSPDYMLPQLDCVSEALGLLLRIQDALDNR